MASRKYLSCSTPPTYIISQPTHMANLNLYLGGQLLLLTHIYFVSQPNHVANLNLFLANQILWLTYLCSLLTNLWSTLVKYISSLVLSQGYLTELSSYDGNFVKGVFSDLHIFFNHHILKFFLKCSIYLLFYQFMTLYISSCLGQIKYYDMLASNFEQIVSIRTI